jgi:hypothetical protein
MIEIEVSGTREFIAKLERMDSSLGQIELDAGTFAAELVIKTARPGVPVQSGAAVSSLRVVDLSGGAAATGGSSVVPYYGWLEFGGTAGRNYSVHRPVVSLGRYLHPAFLEAQGKIQTEMKDVLRDAVQDAGLS